MPTLVAAGADSQPFLPETARTLTPALPDGRLRVLAGQTRAVAAPALAPVLREFLLS